ncbi:myotubularin-related protein 9-like isoform X3 [Scyliorhinus torazame]|uniref:myotubularin-related protein 9-like isoform X3 n=2 Tax=Scyliorhinus torazame TaxID=75743 RepID=UPI003B5B189B
MGAAIFNSWGHKRPVGATISPPQSTCDPWAPPSCPPQDLQATPSCLPHRAWTPTTFHDLSPPRSPSSDASDDQPQLASMTLDQSRPHNLSTASTTVKMNGHVTSCLLDSGSTESFIHPDTTDNWRLSYVNKEFAVCTTYPDAVIVHKCIDDAAIKMVAGFRQGGRFPVFSYYHKKTKMIIMRSSQPLTGANGKRCKEDEHFLAAVIQPDKKGYIIDTRSIQAAHQAKVKGGGFESKTNYHNWKRLHRPIARGRVLQESLIKLVDACNDQSNSIDRWLSKLETSKWLTHLKTVLTTACMAAQCVDREGASVLIHGSEGRDTTLQLTSLAQIILDPDCRTISGFQALIEREWLQAGHPFQLRCASSAYSHAKLKQEAPVFLIFLDCCWQMSCQFPCSFQFNEQFLITLFEHAYASCFGTFLCNNEKERFTLNVKEQTISIWARMNSPSERKHYVNPLYERNNFTIWPSVAPQSLQLWQGLFLRWIRTPEHQNEAWEQIKHIVELGSRKANPSSTELSVLKEDYAAN